MGSGSGGFTKYWCGQDNYGKIKLVDKKILKGY